MPTSSPRSGRQQRRAKKANRRKAIVGGIAAVVIVTALVGGYVALSGGGDDDRPEVTAEQQSDTPQGSGDALPELATGHTYTATAKDGVTQVEVFDEAKQGAAPTKTYPNPWLLNGEADKPIKQVYLVERISPDGDWLHVILPERPNGSRGWVRAENFELSDNPWNITISLANHQITVKNGEELFYEGPIAIGADEEPLSDTGGKLTPTPTGIYYIRVLLENSDPTSVYGPYAYGLSAHSETLTEFSGGDAEIGIHGNNDASVLGKSVTHGCIRMDNEKITELSKLLPLGTPVVINEE
jgi:hypothetical protein